MTFDIFNLLSFGSDQIELFEFQRGTTVTRFVASRRSRVGAIETYIGEDWEAASISHGEIDISSGFERSEVLITLPNSVQFVADYGLGESIEQTLITIRQGFISDPDQEFSVLYRGRLIGVRPDETTTEFVFEDLLTTGRRQGITSTIDVFCRYHVYSNRCGLNIADFQEEFDVIDITNNTLTVVPVPPPPPDPDEPPPDPDAPEPEPPEEGRFLSGALDFMGVREAVADHVSDPAGDLVTLDTIPLALLAEFTNTGTARVLIAQGCTQTSTICRDRFNNLPNHGGFELIQQLNAFDGRSFA